MNPESWKFLLVESGILGFGRRKSAQGIRNPTDVWNLAFKKVSHSLQISNFSGRVIPLDPFICDLLIAGLALACGHAWHTSEPLMISPKWRACWQAYSLAPAIQQSCYGPFI